MQYFMRRFSYPYPSDNLKYSYADFRRYCIENMMRCFDKIPSKFIKIFASDFDCSTSTIYSIIKHIKIYNEFGIVILPPTLALKKQTAIRDKFTCQYCGIVNPKHSEIDHVIPPISGGVSKSYNLVFSCRPCNREKWSSIKIPDNFQILFLENPEWAAKIKFLHQKQENIKITLILQQSYDEHIRNKNIAYIHSNYRRIKS
ncbi:HNH endonuclease [Polaromonas sp.]|uniref:HNH endonuclease n=1 Tax=Polaromonas sp. TaxID=1869339 RepID=UPI0013BB15D9|nr:HNH endonuclease [Polaromonas sp.]NDP63448.1 HNH endonuclease [Polaromonas sp.]